MNLLSIFEKYVAFIPFTFVDMVWWNLEKNARLVLDAGCGFGDPMNAINKRRKHSFTLGIDIFLPAIRACKNKGIHDAYILSDVRFLPFRERSFDIIVCFEVIEHLGKCEGFKLIAEFERIARRQVMMSTPVGYLHLIRGHRENPDDTHRSGWVPAEFEIREYEVKGINGLKCVSGASYGGVGSRFGGIDAMNNLKKYLVYVLNYLSRPLGYFVPNLAFNMLCVKKMNCHAR